MIGYKGFDKNFCCRGMQYEVGKTYTTSESILLCQQGYHFCKDPLDVLQYYPPNRSRYALVEATGKIDTDITKSCTDKITIVRELTLEDLIAAAEIKLKVQHQGVVGIEVDNYVALTEGQKCIAATSGMCSYACANGYNSAAVTTNYSSFSKSYGYKSVALCTANSSKAEATYISNIAITSGDESTAITEDEKSFAITTGYKSIANAKGKSSIAVAVGPNGIAKGKLGSWLVLAEWENGEPINVQTFLVDNKTVKEDTYYYLKDGKLKKGTLVAGT